MLLADTVSPVAPARRRGSAQLRWSWSSPAASVAFALSWPSRHAAKSSTSRANPSRTAAGELVAGRKTSQKTV